MSDGNHDAINAILLMATALALFGFAFLCFSAAIGLIHWMAQ